MDYPLSSDVSIILGTYNTVNLNSGGEFTCMNCWTILVQTLVDYLGGWRMQFVDVFGFLPVHDFFSPQKKVFFFLCIVFSPNFNWYCTL